MPAPGEEFPSVGMSRADEKSIAAGVARKPGSQEELNSLVFALKSSCPTADFARIIAETIHYLIHVQELSWAMEVYKSYNAMRTNISTTQTGRIETTRASKLEVEKQSRVLGEKQHEDTHILVELPVEEEVDALSCIELDSSLVLFFEYLSIG